MNVRSISNTRPAVNVVVITGSMVSGKGEFDRDGGGEEEGEALKDVV